MLATGTPVVVALTMLDVVAGRGLRVDARALARCRDVAVVEVRPRAGDRLDRLTVAVATALTRGPAAAWVDVDEPALDAAPSDVVARDAPGEDGAAADGAAAAERRYEWVRRVAAASIHRTGGNRPTGSDRVDRVLTSRWFGLPLFFLVMWGVFAATTWLAAPLQSGLSGLVDGPPAAGSATIFDTQA